MTDREMLELAAKAAGIPIHVWGIKGRELVADMTDPSNHKLWSPLTDDGDALRLAVKLGLQVVFGSMGTVVKKVGFPDVFYHAGSDQYQSSRSAIVRAAAEIGRAMG